MVSSKVHGDSDSSTNVIIITPLDSHGCWDKAMIELTANLPQFRRSGRWTQTDSGSLIASWASASISFVLASSSNLSIRLGSRTSHKYTFSNSTTLVCTISDATGGHGYHNRHHLSIPISPQVLSFPNVKPGLLSLFDRLELEDGQQKLVEIALVDWSSVVEVVSIVVDSVGIPFPVSSQPGSLYVDAEILTSWRPSKRHLIRHPTLAYSS